MKAVRIRNYNADPIIEDVAVPEIGAEDVLVRVAAASLNPLDVKLQQGFMHAFFPLTFPYTLGTDLVGTIEQLGPRAGNWQVGMTVVARVDPTSGGAVAEFALVPASYLVEIPQTVSLQKAAGLPTATGTAWQGLFEIADLKQGQTLLVHAGAGGVGSAAIQLARTIGARVIATASGTGIDIARRLGADQVIDYRAEDFARKVSDVDVVLDTIGGDTQQKSFGVLRSGGILLATASSPEETLGKAYNVTPFFVFHASDASRLDKIVQQLDTGAIDVQIDSVFSLKDFNEAFQRQQSGRAHGKIIVLVN